MRYPDFVNESKDIPPGVDFLSDAAATKWAQEAESKLASRIEFFDVFAGAILGHRHAIYRVLELGSGPGFLAEYLLSRCPAIDEYTLLDFSPVMLRLSRERLQSFGHRVSYVQADFKESGWSGNLAGPYDCIVAIQAVHELRHKRHAPKLYETCSTLLSKRGVFLVCDHLPKNDSKRDRGLFMTENEQLDAMRTAGFSQVEVIHRTPDRVACRGIA